MIPTRSSEELRGRTEVNYGSERYELGWKKRQHGRGLHGTNLAHEVGQARA